MKHVRWSLSLLLLAAVVSVGYFQTAGAQEFELAGGRCNCMTPNTGKYGTKAPTDETCPASDCYVDVLSVTD